MAHLAASAVFDSQDEAQRAVAALRDAGVPDASLSIIARHGNRTTTTDGEGTVTDDDHRNLLRGILGGGALGAGLGIAALAIPGVGPLAAAGAIAAAAAPEAAVIGAAAGAALGTLNESLKKHGVSDEDAEYYSDRIKGGGVFVSVDGNAGVDTDEVRQILYRHGGHSSTQTRISDADRDGFVTAGSASGSSGRFADLDRGGAFQGNGSGMGSSPGFGTTTAGQAGGATSGLTSEPPRRSTY